MSANTRVNEPEPPSAEAARADLEQPAASQRLLVLMVGLISGWCLLMQRFGSRGNIYVVMGPFALTVIVVIAALSSQRLRRWFRPTRLAVLGGLGVGIGMTVITYPVYALAHHLLPELGASVAGLYSAAHQTTLAEALPWVLAIIIAEELLWRGALLYVLERRVSPALATAISIASYVVAQLGTGSWIVMLLALVCGTIWTVQRRLTRSLLSPLIAHLIWTPIVILLHPVTSG
jgi:membrane protease YdiL (CAAX protease family)